MITRKQTVKKYTVTAGVLEYGVPFPIYEQNDVLVIWSVEHEGRKEHTLSRGPDYSVRINSAGNGGVVTLVSGRVPVGATLAVISNIPETQELDLYHTAEVDTESLEDELDRQVQMIQQLSDTLSRCIKVGVTSGMTPEQLLETIFHARDQILAGLIFAGNTTGATMVVADGTTTPRSISDRFADIINVKDFGAKGDGVTDDTEAIQKAFSFASTKTSGAFVLFPAGTYLVSKQVLFGGDLCVYAYGATIKATGSASIYGMFANFFGYTSDTPARYAGNGNIVWLGGVIDGSGSEVAEDVARSQMMFFHAENVHVEDVIFKNGRRVHMLEYGACRQVRTINCKFLGNYPPVIDDYFPEAVQLDANTEASSPEGVVADSTPLEDIIFDGCVFGDLTLSGDPNSDTAPMAGVGSHGSDAEQQHKNIVVRNCSFIGMRHFSVTGTSDAYDGLVVENCRFSHIQDRAVHLYQRVGNTTAHFSNIIVRDNVFKDSNSANPIINVVCRSNNPGKHITIVNNHIENGSSAALLNVQYCEYGEISSNSISLTSDQNGTNNACIYTIGCKYMRADENVAFTNGFKNSLARVIVWSTGHSGNQTGRIFTDIDTEEPITYVNTGNGISGLPSSGPAHFRGIGGNTQEGNINSYPAIFLSSPSVYRVPQIGFWGSEAFRLSSYKINENGKAVLDQRLLFISPTSKGANFGPGEDNQRSCGFAPNRWTQVFAVTDAINTSDANEKQAIEAYPDAVLDAWGKVEFRQFLFNDAVEKKGIDNARIHSGMIAQQIVEVFNKHGLDATKYALLCYDKWDDEYETVEIVDSDAVLDDEGNEVTPAKTHLEDRFVTAAGDRYGIRYSEALCLEAAYQRRRADRIEARLAALEAKLGIV